MAALTLLNDYLRLPDGWAHLGGVPAQFPPELADLVSRFPGSAVPPDGETFIASSGQALVGIVMLAKYDAYTAHMKRLYVSPLVRRQGIGQRLTIACIEWAATFGCSRVALDVLPARVGAIALYESLGFWDTSPWTSYPMPMRFLSRSTG